MRIVWALLLGGAVGACTTPTESIEPSGANASSSAGVGASGGAAGGGGSGGALPHDDCESIDLAVPNQLATLPMGCPSQTCTSTGLVPLSDLGSGDYFGAMGGLYCGSNQRPSFHDARGMALAASIEPRSSTGEIDAAGGKIGLVSIGMSNTSQEFGAFISNYANRAELADQLVLVNGALGGQASEAWAETELPWTHLDDVLAAASLTHAQVAAVWIKLTHLEGYSVCSNDPPFDGPVPCWPAGPKKLYDNMVAILQRLKTTFPNVAIAYLSGRIYGGYWNGGPSPDPFAYQSSFAMKALIVDQITGANPDLSEPLVPWLAWGPYLWADGLTPRGDGLTWTVSDFASDGIHPSAQGSAKVADLLWSFLTSETTATPWFVDP